jgi:hypothetical protein
MDWYINTSGVPASDKDPRSLPPYYRTPLKPDVPAERARILDR